MNINILFRRNPRKIICYQTFNYGTSANQIAKAMKKLSILGKSGKRKSWHNTFETPKVLPSASLINKREMSKQGLRRVNVLNKLFMRNITDLMATGEISEELLGKGIQISRVKVTPDFNIVNVFWVASGKDGDVEIEKTLKKAAGAIKHELSELRVMGVVPHITFVKDKKLALVNEVEELLKVAEYPKDYVPSQTAERLKDEFELHHSLSKDLIKKIQALESSESKEDFDELPLPEMQHNVFGLDHNEIMRKIGREKDKVTAAWEQYTTRDGSSSLNSLGSSNVETQQRSEEVKERFRKYLESKEFSAKDRRRRKPRILDPYDDGEIPEVDESVNFHDGDYLDEDSGNKN
uniref:CSON012018 protein n=1 Tax=Culicoides sonorensis TaxID=179676 RepID=A0A336LLF1_CULSO